jgi:mycothiol synthase
VNVAAPTDRDFDEMLELAQEYDRAEFGDTDWTEDELREHLEHAEEAWVLRVDGRIVGWASVERRGDRRVIADGYVHPGWRGHGVGSRLIELTEGAAGAHRPVEIHNATLNTDEATMRFYERRGYRPGRWFWRMVVDLTEEPAAPDVPGIRIAPFDPADARAVHAALEDSFASHWGHEPESFEDWERRRLRADKFRPDLCFVAWDGDEVAGVLLGDWKRVGDWGWVGSLGVRDRWRGRGIGYALLQRSFARFWELGERRVALGVDAQNPTGATRLYERVGMSRLWAAVVFVRELE